MVRINLSLAVILTAALMAAVAFSASLSAATKATVAVDYGKMPLVFEANRGQTDERVEFLSRGQGYTLFLTPGEAVLSLRKPGREARTGDEAFGTARAKRATRAKPGPCVLVGAKQDRLSREARRRDAGWPPYRPPR